MHCLLYLDILWNTGVRDARSSPAHLLKTSFPSTVRANLCSVTEHPLLRAVSSRERADCLGWSPSLEVPRECLDRALLALVWLRSWESLTAWTQWLWKTFPTSMNVYVSYFCFWKMLLFFFFLTTWFFSDYPDLKKFFSFSPPPQRH